MYPYVQNPSARKKAATLFNALAVAAGTVKGDSKDARGVIGASFTVNAANLTGAVDVTIEGRHSTKDAWTAIEGLVATQLTADGGENFPTAAAAPGVTMPRFVRASVIVTTGPSDVQVLMSHALPYEGRQVDHQSRS